MSEFSLSKGLPDPTGPDVDPLDQEENAISADWARFSELLHPGDETIEEIGWVSNEEMTCFSCGESRSIVYFPHPQKSKVCGRCTTVSKEISGETRAESAAQLDKRILASIRSPRLDIDIKMPILGGESRFHRWDLCETRFVENGYYILAHPDGGFCLVLWPAPFESQRIDAHEYPVPPQEAQWPKGVSLTLRALGFGPVLQRGRLAHPNSYLPNDAFEYAVLQRMSSRAPRL